MKRSRPHFSHPIDCGLIRPANVAFYRSPLPAISAHLCEPCPNSASAAWRRSHRGQPFPKLA